MLVVFGQHILIFSDKYCSFPSTGELYIAWERWYKRAILESAKQVRGAERWLRSYPEKVYIDRLCKIPFPLDIPNKEDAKYHLIIVAHGCKDRCISELGGSGSLMFNSIMGQSGNINNLSSVPFCVGDLDKDRTFIHILTEPTLEIVIKTLDTISDFVWYLEKKEKLIRSMKYVSIAGEEDLLAYYLIHTNAMGVHDFTINGSYNGFVLDEGGWEDFYKSPQRLKQIRENEISYGWDNLIERFSHHALNATEYYVSHIELSKTEKVLRLMAREPRTSRRLIMKNVVEMFMNTPDGTRRIRCLNPPTTGGPYYVFLSLPKPNHVQYDNYRKTRRNLLAACVMVAKHNFPEALDIVGIAAEPIQSEIESSEDFFYLDARIWSAEMDNEAMELQRKLNILTSPKISISREKDYPD